MATRRPPRRTVRHLVAFGLAAALLAALLPGSASADTGTLRLEVVSSPRVDMVSDGDALVRVALPDGAEPGQVVVRLDARDVTAAFTADAGGRSLTGLVEGLRNGANTLVATVRSGGARPAVLTLTGHPRTGPMLAGPHEKPFVCGAAAFTTLAGDKLGPATDANCSAPTRVDYLYRSTVDRSLRRLASPTDRPADLATATTTDGRTVPYIVRAETGVINRSIYEYAVLHDPAAGEPSYRHRPTGWNGAAAVHLRRRLPGRLVPAGQQHRRRRR